MLGNRGASLTTEPSAAFPSTEDASPDSPHSKPKHSGGTTFINLKEDVSLFGSRPGSRPVETGFVSSPSPDLPGDLGADFYS